MAVQGAPEPRAVLRKGDSTTQKLGGGTTMRDLDRAPSASTIMAFPTNLSNFIMSLIKTVR